MRKIDEQYLKTPFYGSRRFVVWLAKQGYQVNRKRVTRLMRVMGIQAVYPKKKTSRKNHEHKVYPYRLRNLEITRPDQVWATDITYIPMYRGFVYLVAIMDWYSRFVLSWNLSISMEVEFCIEALYQALEISNPEIFNSDQGVQFTSKRFTQILVDKNVKISMDGRGRVFDNIFIERLWRSLKYEEVYLKDYESLREACRSIADYFYFYNYERPHQSLGYTEPYRVYTQARQGVKDKVLEAKQLGSFPPSEAYGTYLWTPPTQISEGTLLHSDREGKCCTTDNWNLLSQLEPNMLAKIKQLKEEKGSL